MKRVLILALCSVFLASAYEPHGYSFDVPDKTWTDCEIADTIFENVKQTKIESDASWEYLKTIIEPNYDLLKQIGPLIITIEENELEIAKSYETAVLLQTSTSSQAIELLTGVQETSDFEIDNAYEVLQTAMAELKSTFTYKERAALIEEIKTTLQNLLDRHSKKIPEVKNRVKADYTVKLPGLKKELDKAVSLCAKDEVYRGKFDLYAPFENTFEKYSNEVVDLSMSEGDQATLPLTVSGGEKIMIEFTPKTAWTLSFHIDNFHISGENSTPAKLSIEGGFAVLIGNLGFSTQAEYDSVVQSEVESNDNYFYISMVNNKKVGVLYQGIFSQYESENFDLGSHFTISSTDDSTTVSQILFKYEYTNLGKADQDCEVKHTPLGRCSAACGVGEITYKIEVVSKPYGKGKACPDDSTVTKLCQTEVCPLSLPGNYKFSGVKSAMQVDTDMPYVKEGIYSSSHIQIIFKSEIELRAAILEFTFKTLEYDSDTKTVNPTSEKSRTYTFSVVNREKKFHEDGITGKRNVLTIKVPNLVITDMTISTLSMEPTCSSNCLNFFKNNGICEAACYNSGCGWDGDDCQDKKCSEKCTLDMVGNGVCDDECDTPECNYDSEDCKCKKTGCDVKLLGNKQCDATCNNPECSYDADDCLCANTGCDTSKLSNSYCNKECNNPQCKFDGNDCKCVETGCPDGWFNNGSCQPKCQNEECGYDNPDCTTYCENNCKTQQINDGVCDPQCKNSEKCKFDGDDCKPVPDCAPGCGRLMRGDKTCNTECMVEACGYDDGDCTQCQLDGCPVGFDLNQECNQECNIKSCSYDNGFCPNCAPTCTPAMIKNGICDPECFNQDCGWDKEDCGDRCSVNCLNSMIRDGKCDDECQTVECDFDWEDCKLCSKGCQKKYLGDKSCNSVCNNKKCGYDLGDCPVPACAPECKLTMIEDGKCDKSCFNEACGFDAPDCDGICDIGCLKTMLGDGICQRECLSKRCGKDSNDCVRAECHPKCYASWLGNGVCDEECNNSFCEYDKGDCLPADYCTKDCKKAKIGNGTCDPECDNNFCSFDGNDCMKPCSDGCTYAMQNNDKCDEACNVALCKYDNKKCTPPEDEDCAVGCKPNMIANKICNSECFTKYCGYDMGDCRPCECPYEFVGDKKCQQECYNKDCFWDKGDCDKEMEQKK
jgi:hypothetical protein